MAGADLLLKLYLKTAAPCFTGIVFFFSFNNGARHLRPNYAASIPACRRVTPPQSLSLLPTSLGIHCIDKRCGSRFILPSRISFTCYLASQSVLGRTIFMAPAHTLTTLINAHQIAHWWGCGCVTPHQHDSKFSCNTSKYALSGDPSTLIYFREPKAHFDARWIDRQRERLVTLSPPA